MNVSDLSLLILIFFSADKFDILCAILAKQKKKLTINVYISTMLSSYCHAASAFYVRANGVMQVKKNLWIMAEICPHINNLYQWCDCRRIELIITDHIAAPTEKKMENKQQKVRNCQIRIAKYYNSERKVNQFIQRFSGCTEVCAIGIRGELYYRIENRNESFLCSNVDCSVSVHSISQISLSEWVFNPIISVYGRIISYFAHSQCSYIYGRGEPFLTSAWKNAERQKLGTRMDKKLHNNKQPFSICELWRGLNRW